MSQERQALNMKNKTSFLRGNRIFELDRSDYYWNVLASDEPTAQKASSKVVVGFSNNLYRSEANTWDYSDIVQKAFTAANDKGDLKITLGDVQAAVKCAHN